MGESGTVTGADPSAEAIAYNQRRDPSHRYIRSTAQELAFPDAAFDVVTCTFVMHHIPEQQRGTALAEMWRVLRPGGRLLLADAHPSDRLRAVFAGINRLQRKRPVDPFADADIRHYADALRSAGFAEPAFVRSRDHTGILVAVKPSAGGLSGGMDRID